VTLHVTALLVAIALGASLAAQAVHPPAENVLRITRAARALAPGEVALITITAPPDTTSVQASAFGHELSPYREDERTWRTLVGIDLATTAGTYTLTARASVAGVLVEQTYALAVAAKRFPTRRLAVDDRYVAPPPEVLTRIEQEAAALAALWNASAAERLWIGPFVRPVPHAANSAFGSRSVFNGQPRAPHAGADFLSPAGTVVHAPNAGRVALARDLYFSGQTVVVDHGLGLMSLFAHLTRIDVEPGAAVRAGQSIGLVGATGRVTGAHLHWAVRLRGARVDPLSLLSVLGKDSK
jgi:hypothetical protein